ncbi:MAG TPA: MFS transporter [Candidatus Dormibacteraeota bacterium]|nr:MFS transporter [Candidatus Dormibacteraeota bacterium]
MVLNAASSSRNPVAERTLRHVNRRLMPYLILLYVVAYLDRVNVGYAGLQMTRELGFSNAVFGFGGGIFFVGYMLLEIPGGVLAELWSARKWISRILLTWGFLASATGLIHTARQFYWLRFFLGLAEAGFLPALLVYISHWYRPADRGKAVAMFMASIPASQIIGGPLSAIFLRIHWLGTSGWRWLLLLEGIPALILGVVTLFYLTDHPAEAKWMRADEREWLMGELEKEREARISHVPAWKSLGDPRVLLLCGTLFLGLTATYGVSLWMPKIVEKLSSFGVSKVSLIAAIPYLVALPVMWLAGWSSDRLGERKWHAAVPRIIAGAALAGCIYSADHVWISVMLLSVAAAGFYSSHAGFWPMPNMLLGSAAAATSIGLINVFGSLGGFVGPYMIGYLRDRTGGFGASLLFLAVCSVASGLLVLCVRLPAKQASHSE